MTGDRLKTKGVKLLNFSLRVTRYALLLNFPLLLAFCSLLLVGCSLPRIVVLEDPLSPEEHVNLGVAYERKGELDSAISEYEAASGELPVAYLYLGNAYFRKNELREAERYYRKALEKDPRNGDAHNNLAWLYYTKKENLEEAESLAIRALELNPGKRELYQDTLEKIRELKSHPVK